MARRGSMSLKDLLFGPILANRDSDSRKIGALEGVPAMGLDGLGSAAYGPEAALTILVPLGAAGLGVMQGITWAVLALLAALFLSYWQTITAYPSSGGSYTVARENLGRDAGLLAAAALMVDYMLNVAVGISAGVGALVSALPSLQPWTLPVCLVILAVITLVNLRGTKETGLALAVPTYLFVATLAGTLTYGLWLAARSGGHPTPVVAPPAVPRASEALTAWIVLRGFASGCTAMTGVEAVSNGVSAFKQPTIRYAHRTLTAIVVILGLLLAGIALLARAYGIAAMNETQPGYQSVLSQLVAAVAGRGWFYYLALGSVLCVLCLSANTSFVGFPRLCRQVARDGFLPHAFAIAGRRLVYAVGILFLAMGAGALLILFGGITDRLIPLFAVGAFLSFTLSQAGMAVHWRRQGRGGANRLRLLVNAVGGLATGAALAVILAAKFTEGAWLTLIVIPAALFLLYLTNGYYRTLDREVLNGSRRRLDFADHAPPVMIIPVLRWSRIARQTVRMAVRLSPDVVGLHLVDLEGPEAEDQDARLRTDWLHFVEEPAIEAGLNPPRLEIRSSPYRSLLAPLVRLVREMQARCPDRPVIVAVPELVGERWWEFVLHTQRLRRLRGRLLRACGPDVSVLVVPWQLAASDPARLLAEEEPSSFAPPALGEAHAHP